jgi:hypothetical protein
MARIIIRLTFIVYRLRPDTPMATILITALPAA